MNFNLWMVTQDASLVFFRLRQSRATYHKFFSPAKGKGAIAQLFFTGWPIFIDVGRHVAVLYTVATQQALARNESLQQNATEQNITEGGGGGFVYGGGQMSMTIDGLGAFEISTKQLMDSFYCINIVFCTFTVHTAHTRPPDPVLLLHSSLQCKRPF
jgi:hypothetical protein